MRVEATGEERVVTTPQVEVEVEEEGLIEETDEQREMRERAAGFLRVLMGRGGWVLGEGDGVIKRGFGGGFEED